MAATQAFFIVWRNRDSVILGRGQNSWLEANLPYLKEQRIPLLRCMSGGGAVYNDTGNVNFTFMAHKLFYRKAAAIDRVNRLLGRMGFESSMTERRDIMIRGSGGRFKGSGSAYREGGERGLQHGTLLIDTDLDRLRKALAPLPKDIDTRCIRSVRSPVVNLKDIDARVSVDAVMSALMAEFQGFLSDWGATEVQTVALEESQPAGGDLPQHMASWEWVCGKTPRFAQRWPGAFGDARIAGVVDVNQGRICDFSVDPTCRQEQEETEPMRTLLLGCEFRADPLLQQLSGFQLPPMTENSALG